MFLPTTSIVPTILFLTFQNSALAMDCTQDEIADAVGWPQQSVARWLEGITHFPIFGFLGNTEETDSDDSPFTLTKAELAAADHAVDFEVPLYNVWKQQNKSAGSSHFGNSEVRWVDNLLYLYTKPFDIVVDPFAGGGSSHEREHQQGLMLLYEQALNSRYGWPLKSETPNRADHEAHAACATIQSIARLQPAPQKWRQSLLYRLCEWWCRRTCCCSPCANAPAERPVGINRNRFL